MKIQYFSDTDTLYIALADRASQSSEAITENLIVDYDDQDKPVGLTIEHYSQVADSPAIETVLPLPLAEIRASA
jgi:uncharacterized protein YuzE